MKRKYPEGRAIFHVYCEFLNTASSSEENMEYVRFPGTNLFLFAVSKDYARWKMVAAVAGLRRDSLVMVRGAEILAEVEGYSDF